MFEAKILCGVFALTGSCLLINLILTIVTDPGEIPDGPEWEMPEEEKEDDESRRSSLALPHGRPEAAGDDRFSQLDSVKSDLNSELSL